MTNRSRLLLSILAFVNPWLPGAAAETHTLTIDASVSAGELRALHGINKGPLSANGLVDVTAALQAVHPPVIRLHDCHHPNPDVVDIHAVFPNPGADPELPDSYDFRATDEYLSAAKATGAEIIYRLGESIEHQKVNRHVHPPCDPARWAAVCAGIVRHYNNGWANGFHHQIRCWEIWNEPENRPVMWTGTDAQFLELYRVTARRLRAEFPDIKIGGPGFGYYGRFDGKDLQPSEFCSAFLDLCRTESLPLDFFSWHCYTDQPPELAARAGAIRRLLDSRGFPKTESHLTEWNFLPGNSWDALSRTAAPEIRQQAVEAMAGAPGTAFTAASLIALQDARVDVAGFYHGECGIFGLFTEVGAPVRCYSALLAFDRLRETPHRIGIAGAIPGKLAVAAGFNDGKTRAGILIASQSGPEELRLSLASWPWASPPGVRMSVVNAAQDLKPVAAPQVESGTLTIHLPPPAVALIELIAPETKR